MDRCSVGRRILRPRTGPGGPLVAARNAPRADAGCRSLASRRGRGGR